MQIKPYQNDFIAHTASDELVPMLIQTKDDIEFLYESKEINLVQKEVSLKFIEAYNKMLEKSKNYQLFE